MAHARNGCSQSSRFLPQARGIVGSGDENATSLKENVLDGDGLSTYEISSFQISNVDSSVLPFDVENTAQWSFLILFKPFEVATVRGSKLLVPVVRRLVNTIHRINRFRWISVNKIKPRYPLDSDLSGG